MKKIILLAFLFFSFLSSAKAIEIDNFKSGLVCINNSICHESNTIYVTGQSQCVYGGETLPCTWHGFEFDYENHSSGEEIICSFKTSHPSSMGNPDEIISKGVTEDSYKLTIPVGDGHFFNPQYRIFSTLEKDSHVLKSSTKCSIEEQELFSYEFTFIYPKNP